MIFACDSDKLSLLTQQNAEKSGYQRDLRLLADIARETFSSLHLGQLLWRVVQLLRSRFGYEFAAIGLVEDDALVFEAGAGTVGDLSEPLKEGPYRLPLGRGVVGRVAQHGVAAMGGACEEEPFALAAAALGGCGAEIAVPLLYGGQTIGVIVVQSRAAGALDETDLQLLQLVSSVVAPAIDAAKRFEHEQRRVRDLRLVHDISRLVMSALDRERLIDVSCAAISEALDIDFVAITLVEASGSRVVQAGYACRAPFVSGLDFDAWSLMLGDGVVGDTIARGVTNCVSDTRAHQAYREVVEDMRSHLSVPLFVQGEVVGALVLEDSVVRRFGEDDGRLAENLAGYLAQAIDNAWLFEVQRERWQQLLLINEVARLATAPVQLEEIIAVLVTELHERFGYEAAAVMLVDDDQLVLRAQAGSHLVLPLGYTEPRGDGIVNATLVEGRSQLAGNAEAFANSLPLSPASQSILCVPLAAGERISGIVRVESTQPFAFDRDDRLVIETLAGSVSGAVANARAIRNAEWLREDLNRMVVHDLRNPLQGIRLALNELAEEPLPERAREFVEGSLTGCDDVLALVNSLLDISRIEAGHGRLRLSPAAVNDHLRVAVRRFVMVARSKSIQVTTVLSGEVPALWLDHELFDRLVSNLLGNALKFTPPKGQVTITSEALGAVGQRERFPQLKGIETGVLLSFRDTGEGIPAAYHHRIFEKFGQVDSRKAGLTMSTGLGLALCRFAVEAHGGTIWVESEVGTGATFFVALPKRPPGTELPGERAD